MKLKQLRKFFILKLFLFFLLLGVSAPDFCSAAENKIIVAAGYFSITGQNSVTGKTVRVSGLGAIQLRYLRAITQHLEVGAGYTVSYDKTIGGNSIFGLDVGLNYFPITATHGIVSASPDIQMSVSEFYRPFIGISFVQRNFSGIQTGYSGLAFAIGSEFHLNTNYDLVAMAKYSALAASSEASVKELSAVIGIVLGF